MLRYFTDPVLQAPTLGSILMCFSSAIVGVIVFLRKRSLLGEALSHAAYPGVVLSVLFMAVFFPDQHDFLSVAILVGAFITSLLGLWLIEKMGLNFGVQSDAALCFVLSTFFGVGILIASRLQFSHALFYKTVQIFLYGQAATMTDIHVLLYGVLALVVLIVVVLFKRQISMTIFDRDFAKSVGVSTGLLDGILFFLLVLAIVIGIRSVGVVLMAGMLIAPAVAARQMTQRLGLVFFFAGMIGAVSGFLGNYLSVEIPRWSANGRFSLPTGPMILLSASFFCLVSLLFAPHNGLVSRLLRVARFRRQCMGENLLKFLWRQNEGRGMSYVQLHRWQPISAVATWLLVRSLSKQGWVSSSGANQIELTREGRLRAAHIVRLHRLWEAYLVHIGQGVEKVHRSAEEMEHIITPELEMALTELLGDPKHDPHLQPIPPGRDVL